MDLLQHSQTWWGLAQIVWINILLSGDNAVVIALAARTLPPRQQRLAVLAGAGAAVVLRILLTVVAVRLLALPYVQILGGVLLLGIGIELLLDEDQTQRPLPPAGSLVAAVRTILLADLVMSLDNVIAVAAAAKGSMFLLVAGLGLSIPLVVFGSTLMLWLMQRVPHIVAFGACLIGWVAADTIQVDLALRAFMDAHAPLRWLAAPLGAAAVLVVGLAWRHWRVRRVDVV